MPAQIIQARHYTSRQVLRVRWPDGTLTGCDAAATHTDTPWWIAPGLFDAQVNGFGGVDFQAEPLSLEAALAATHALRGAGCTRYLATLVTDEWERLLAKLSRFRELRARSAELQAAIAGWHLEGPFLSSAPGFHGAHDPALMLDPTPERLQRLREVAGNDLLLLTVAPERPGAIAAIAQAVRLGIRISLGHTDASAETLAQAVAAGATGFTHLGNACPQLLDRHDNILWRALTTPGLTVSLIPDGVHVSPALFQLIHRLLPTERLVYVSDAMAAGGASPGRYRLGHLEVEVGADGVVRQPGKSNYAGSALRPIEGVFRAARMSGMEWQGAWRRFSEAPCAWLGLPTRLAVGEPADACLLRVSPAGELEELRVVGGGRQLEQGGADLPH